MLRGGLPIVFVLALLVPGAAIGVLALRALVQDQRLADHDFRERLERAGEDALQRLERELSDWSSSLDRIGDDVSNDALIPPLLRPAFAIGAGLLVSAASERVTTSASYRERSDGLSDGGRPREPSLAVAEAEALERTSSDSELISRRYRQLLDVVSADERPRVLHRLARLLKRMRQDGEALHLYQQLQSSHGRIGVLPAGLVGRFEVCAHYTGAGNPAALLTCARELLRRLEKEWHLPRERYLYYASAAAGWLSASIFPKDCDSASEALTGTLTTQDSLVVWRCGVAGVPRSAYILDAAWLHANVGPALQPGAPSAPGAYDVEFFDQEARAWFGSAEGSAPIDAVAVLRDGAGLLQGWRVRVAARDPSAFAATLAARQRMYGLMLALVFASIGFGAYATTRAVKRELQIAQLKSEFVATVSHEFRSPLTAIRQLGEMLMRGRVPDERRPEYYERITRESERLGRLVENVLDFAQIEAGRKCYQRQRLDPAAWLRRSVSEFQSVRQEQGVMVQARIPDALPVLLGDAAALTTAVHNLLDNAVKYSPGEGTVWLDAAAVPSGLVIRVRDRGIGISDADKTQIFNKFYRVAGDVSRQVKGAGLGLSLVQHIVAAHGGRVDCDSRVSEGTTFSIHLPVVRA